MDRPASGGEHADKANNKPAAQTAALMIHSFVASVC
jgi:hypothetical protein